MTTLKRGTRGSGILVDPERLREARRAAGLTMAELAGDDISRTFIHQLENGLARPSAGVLKMIARRTNKPVGYFMAPGSDVHLSKQILASDLVRLAAKVRKFRESASLDLGGRESLKLLESALRQGAVVTRNL